MTNTAIVAFATSRKIVFCFILEKKDPFKKVVHTQNRSIKSCTKFIFLDYVQHILYFAQVVIHLLTSITCSCTYIVGNNRRWLHIFNAFNSSSKPQTVRLWISSIQYAHLCLLFSYLRKIRMKLIRHVYFLMHIKTQIKTCYFEAVKEFISLISKINVKTICCILLNKSYQLM